MAKMFPETYPKEHAQGDPEYEMFEKLRDLPDSFSVIYSKKFKGGARSKEEAEIDFLVFDGCKNLICLEVKGGEIAYNGPERAWYQNGRRMTKEPDWQASTGSHAVIEFLGRDGEKVNINWALAFPHCSRPAGSGVIPEVANELILDSTALLDLLEAVNKVCEYNESHMGREGVRRHQASVILERLLRSVGFITKIGVRLLHDQQQLVQVTEQQLEVLEDLELNEKTAVMGYAGTGKTIIATEFAKRMSEAGKKVLLLFYNRAIANTVRYGLGRDSPIECATFHGLAKQVIGVSDAAWWRANAKKDDREFWETHVPLKMLESMEGHDPEYDVIIVDEGQDFKSEWFETLEQLLVPSTDSRFVVFYDQHQDIFGRWTDLPWQPEQVTKKLLRKNCRNTKEIIRYLKDLAPSEMKAFERSPEGQPVVIKTATDISEQVEFIRQDLDKMLRDGIEPGKIVILIDSPMAESAVSKIEQVGRCKLDWMGRTYRADSRNIQITNINNFKGLEADVVFIVSNSDHGEGSDILELYTQASRAKLLLRLFKMG